jgi:cephalosporin hydroxylase
MYHRLRRDFHGAVLPMPRRVTIIDEEAATVTVQDDNGAHAFPMASAEGFAAASQAWLRAGWDAKHVYSFSWLGRPIIQLPEDMFRLQEVIVSLRPDVIIETGVAHGGSLVFHASLCQLLGCGRVIGIDIEIRPHNRKALEAHTLAPLIHLIEGHSISPETLAQVSGAIQPGERVLILLDSNHTRDHVLAELRAYAPFVSPGSWIVACDGIMAQVAGGPRTSPDWSWDNPLSAVQTFLAETNEFLLAPPPFTFNESLVTAPVTYWPQAWLQRVTPQPK